MTELLSPVGNMECLKAAINAGCDAVYLAGINFGARSFAGNFSNEELIEAINLCHLYGVKVYVTVNTLIYDVEVDRFIKYIDFLHSNNVDAVIMQDIGMIDLVRKTYPNLEIHVSTQAHIHNLEGARLCEELGVKRIVLARETPIELVREIKENTNLEIEIFVQGALCMSYSGQCLMSYLIGGRSGNRGTCAQPCRQPYSLIIDNELKESGYLLSTKDLNTLDYVSKLVDMGIDSLKIEGRMKRKEYVYLVTSLYRKAIDKKRITDNDIKDLKKVFNREFTKGFLNHEDNDNFTNTFRPNHIGINVGKVVNINKDIVSIKLTDSVSKLDGIRILTSEDIGLTITNIFINGKRVEEANPGNIIDLKVKGKASIGDIVVKTTDNKELLDIDKKIEIDKKIPIKGKFTFRLGKPIEAVITDSKNEVTVYSDYIIEESKTSSMDKERISNQLNKLGDTVYEFESIDITLDNNIFVPVNILNDIRRKCCEELNQKRLYKSNYKKEHYYIEVPDFKKEALKTMLVHTYEEYLKNKDLYDIIYIDDKKEYERINDIKCILKLPRVLEHLDEYNNELLVGELGSIYKYKNINTDFSLNVLNSYSVAFLHSLGVNRITLSHELNYKQIERLVNSYHDRYNKHPNLEVITESNIEAMICKYNMLKKYNKDSGILKDKFGNKYTLKIKDNLMYIYDYKKTILEGNFYDIGINSIRINL